jgi:hypothetical protein
MARSSKGLAVRGYGRDVIKPWEKEKKVGRDGITEVRSFVSFHSIFSLLISYSNGIYRPDRILQPKLDQTKTDLKGSTLSRSSKGRQGSVSKTFPNLGSTPIKCFLACWKSNPRLAGITRVGSK